MLFKVMMNQNFEQNCINDQNGIDKINLKSANLTRIKVVVGFYQVSDVTLRKFTVRLCTCFSEMTLRCAYLSRCAK